MYVLTSLSRYHNAVQSCMGAEVPAAKAAEAKPAEG